MPAGRRLLVHRARRHSPHDQRRVLVDVDASRTDGVQGSTFFELVGSYNPVDSTVPRFLSRNATDKASLYWGDSMLHVYWMVLSKAYYDSAAGTKQGNDSTYSGVINLKRRSNATDGAEEEVLSDNFFKLLCFTEYSYCGNDSIPWLSQGNQEWDPYPDIWSSMNTLGKAMWFTVMTDLGQNFSGVPNMLAYPDLLQALSGNLTNEVLYWKDRRAAQNGSTIGILMEMDLGLSLKSFDPAQTPVPNLGASTVTLSSNYICQVPKVKAAGTIIFSVLVVNFVLPQASWTLFKLIVDTIVQRRFPAMMHCEGCCKIQAPGSAVAMVVRGAPYGSSETQHPKYSEVAQTDVL